MTSGPLDSSTSKIDSGGLTQPLIPNSDSSLQEPLSDSSTLPLELSKQEKIDNYKMYKQLDDRHLLYSFLAVLGSLATVGLIFATLQSSLKELDPETGEWANPNPKLTNILAGITTGVGLLTVISIRMLIKTYEEKDNYYEKNKQTIDEGRKLFEASENEGKMKETAEKERAVHSFKLEAVSGEGVVKGIIFQDEAGKLRLVYHAAKE